MCLSLSDASSGRLSAAVQRLLVRRTGVHCCAMLVACPCICPGFKCKAKMPFASVPSVGAFSLAIEVRKMQRVVAYGTSWPRMQHVAYYSAGLSVGLKQVMQS